MSKNPNRINLLWWIAHWIIYFSRDKVWILLYLVRFLFSVIYFYFLLSGFINLTSLVISYEFLSFIQLAYRWLITYCALVLLILSRMMHQVPYDTLVLICDWWLGTFNYLGKKVPSLHSVWLVQLKWFDAKWGKKSTLILWKNAICGKPPSSCLQR